MRKLIERIKRLLDMFRAKPQPKPEPQPKPLPEIGINKFLWKPVSESRGGRAAVLLPAKIDEAIVTVNGEMPAENRGRTNGNRLTFFLAKTGAAYGSNVKVRAYDGAELINEWTVPDGAARYER